MSNNFSVTVQKLRSNPRQLFLIDCVGALLTGFLLIAVVANFESVFGMPQPVVQVLALIAFAFSVYSGCCYGLVTRWRPYLIAIALANLTYCAVPLGLLIYFYQRVTAWGLAYFLGEVVVIGSLVAIEWAAVTQPVTNRNVSQPD